MSDSTVVPVSSTSMFSNKTYDRAKFLVQVVLPALGTLYFALAKIWGFPAAEAVIGTITAITLFLGVTLKISNNSYVKSDDSRAIAIDGYVSAVPHENGEDTNFKFTLDPNDLVDKEHIVLKVRSAGEHRYPEDDL